MTRERILIPWSSNPSDFWEVTQNLIPEMRALGLGAGENRSRYHNSDDNLILRRTIMDAQEMSR